MAKSNRNADSGDIHPDAWKRFERAVDVVAKSPPQHRKKTSATKKHRALRKKGSPARKPD
jgi:hypothetical protein